MNKAINIPGYEILLKIGEGATATVWRARQQSLDREVAIKILKPQFTADAEEVASFLREARAAAKLKSHNIIQVYDVGQHEETIYFVMECVNGHTLGTIMAIGDPIAQKRALSIAASVAEALADAWKAEKIIHRDIKPENIIIEKGGGVKLADLGLSGMVDNKGHLEGDDGCIAGTPNYMAPEQAAGSENVSFSADMYSLGAVLYYMLTGQLPFNGRPPTDILQAQIHEQLRFPQDINPKVSSSCGQLIARMMMKKPDDRYHDWESAIADIKKLMDGKVLVLKPLAGSGSTIAAKDGSVPVDRKAAARQRKPITRSSMPAATVDTAARAAALHRKYSNPGIPLWLRVPISAALLALFGWLGFSLLWVPFQEAYPTVIPAIPVTEPPLANLAPPVRERVRPPVEEPVQSTDPLDAIPEPEPRQAPEPTQTVESIADTVTEKPEPNYGQLAKLKANLVETALSSGLEAAEKQLQQTRNNAALSNAGGELNELERFFDKSNQPETIIAEAFKKLIGQETFVNIAGRRVDFQVEAVNGNSISTKVKALSGGATVYRPAEFKISQLSPEEQRRWMGEPDTPEKAFSAAMLDLSAANYAGAAKQADTCGALSDATRKFAEQRIKMLLE